MDGEVIMFVLIVFGMCVDLFILFLVRFVVGLDIGVVGVVGGLGGILVGEFWLG